MLSGTKVLNFKAFVEIETRVELSTQYPCRIIRSLKIHKWISIYLCYIHEPWVCIGVFLNEWIFRHGNYHELCMDTSTCDQVYFCGEE